MTDAERWEAAFARLHDFVGFAAGEAQEVMERNSYERVCSTDELAEVVSLFWDTYDEGHRILEGV